MNKPTVSYLYNEILFRNQKERTTDSCKNMDESQKYYTEQKNPDTKECLL